ncbi:MAG: NUDIX hydrolase [Methanosarcinales archaeon]|nr:NUDIX hydrolase [Methanosarcinales archaeon]
MDIRTPLLAVDIVILYGQGLVLIRRDHPPFEGKYALPGGFVEVGESTGAGAQREAREETGLEVEIRGLVGVYSQPDRDPRGHVVSVCYLARGSGRLRAGSDARAARVFSPDRLPDLAFDHRLIIDDAMKHPEFLEFLEIPKIP